MVQKNEIGVCPNSVQIRDFLDGSLSIDDQTLVANHLETCEQCESYLSLLEESFDKFGDFLKSTEHHNENYCDVDLSPTGLFKRNVDLSKPEFTDLIDQIKLSCFELDGVLGHGGMGIVFDAVEKSTQRRVALKVIDPAKLSSFFSDENVTLTQRFESEIAATAQIENDNVVTLYSSGIDNGFRYFAMQLVDGPSLSGMVRKGLCCQKSAEIIKEVALGLGAAHEHGILHRDIKPSNILFSTKLNRALLSDFGLARFEQGKIDNRLTNTESPLGTLDFVSPEQLDNATKADIRSDVFSLGATLYYCLTGRPPFYSESVTEQVRQLVEQDPIPPSQITAGIPSDLESICLKCLEKSSGNRYASANELADDLDRFLSGNPTLARPAGAVEKLVKWIKRNRTVTALAAITFVSIVAGIAALTNSYIREVQSNRLLAEKNYQLQEVNKEKTEINTELAQSIVNEKAANRKASTALKVAQDVAFELSIKISESREFLKNIDGVQEIRQSMLETAKEQLDRLDVEQSSPSLTYGNSNLLLASARLGIQLGKYQEALQSLDDAEKKTLALLATPDIDAELSLVALKQQLLSIQFQKGKLQSLGGARNRADETLESSWKLANELFELEDSLLRRRYISQIASAYSMNLHRMGNKSLAENVLLKAEKNASETINLLSQKVEAGEEAARYSSDYAAAVNLMNTLSYFQRFSLSPKPLERLVSCVDLLAKIPNANLSPQLRKLRAGIYMNFGAMGKKSMPDKSFEYRKIAVTEFRKLVESNPNIPEFKLQAVKAIRNLGSEYIGKSKLEQANELLVESEQMSQELLENYPDKIAYLDASALVLDAKARYQYARERSDLAEKYFNEILEIRKRLLEKEPNSQNRIRAIGFCHFQLAELAKEERQYVKAIDQLKLASKICEQLTGGHKKSLEDLIRQLNETISKRLIPTTVIFRRP